MNPMIYLHHSGRAWDSSPVPRPLSTPSELFPPCFGSFSPLDSPPGARDSFFSLRLRHPHSRGCARRGRGSSPCLAGASCPGWSPGSRSLPWLRPPGPFPFHNWANLFLSDLSASVYKPRLNNKEYSRKTWCFFSSPFCQESGFLG